MRLQILVLAILICPTVVLAQHSNKVIFDEMVNQNILYGKVTPADFKTEPFNTWYSENYDSYLPDNAVMNELKLLLKGVTFELIASTWCPDSKRETPRFLKLLNQLNIPCDSINIIAVNRKKVCPEAGVDKGYIDFVPTFIIRSNEMEIGRIIERPTKTLEEDLLSILRKD